MKKILSVLLCLVLALGVFPAFGTVASATDTKIYIGLIEVSSGGYLLPGASYAVNESALPTDFDRENDSYAYVNGCELHLVNFTYNGEGYGASGETKAAIRSTGSMHLSLYGINNITCTTPGAVAVKVEDLLYVERNYNYTEFIIPPTLNATASNGFMVENASSIAYEQRDVNVTLNVGENGRGIMISSSDNSLSLISVNLISGTLSINGNDATSGIEVISSGTVNSYLQNQVASLSIKGCNHGTITDNVELIDGTVKISTTGGYGMTATKGSIAIRSTDVDIKVEGVEYDAMHAATMINPNLKTCEIYSGGFTQSNLRIKPKKYVIVGGVYLNDGEYLAKSSSVASTIKPEGGYAHYTAGVTGGKLELNNFSYQGAGSSYLYCLGTNYREQYNACIFTPYSTELILKGTNTLKSTNSEDLIDGIVVYGSLVVNGDGELTIEGNIDFAISVVSNQMTLYAELIVDSGILNLCGHESVSVYATVNDNGAAFTVNGGECNLTGDVAVYADYNSFAKVNVNGGTINMAASPVPVSLIYIYSNVEAVYSQTGGKVKISGTEYQTAITSYTVDYNGVIEFSGGEFIAAGSPLNGTFVTDNFYLNDPMEVVEGDYDTDYIRIADRNTLGGSDEPIGAIIGDANGDGYVNSLDAAQILKYDAMMISWDMIDLYCADVNRDGYVDSLDAARILKFDAGIIVEF